MNRSFSPLFQQPLDGLKISRPRSADSKTNLVKQTGGRRKNSEETVHISFMRRPPGGIFYVQTIGGFRRRLRSPTYLPGNPEAAKYLTSPFKLCSVWLKNEEVIQLIQSKWIPYQA